MTFAAHALAWLVNLFVLAIGVIVLVAVVLYIVDRTQTADAIRRNYPLVGRFRGWFSRLGEFFRQYFFAMDREEMPFNRAQREWVYRAGRGEGNTARNLRKPLCIPFRKFYHRRRLSEDAD